jgi:formylglycine-generating enzyme required for sulfatase activity
MYYQFTMGDYRRGAGIGVRGKDTGRLRHIRFTHVESVKAFRINVFTVTNAQYELFEPDHKRYKKSVQDDQPVVNVSFWDAYCFAIWVGCRLPTEVEWEFACRAGTKTSYSFGDSISGTSVNCKDDDRDGTKERGPYLDRTVSLAEREFKFTGHRICYTANNWGLWHMHGNVEEWCNAKFKNDMIARGGSYSSHPILCTSFHRNHGYSFYTSFRLVWRDDFE